MTPKEKREYYKKWRKNNSEKTAKYRKEWKKNNPSKFKALRNKFNKKYFAKFAGPLKNQNHYQRWTITDINLILFSPLTDRELHRLIGRSLHAIQVMRDKMKKGGK